MIHHRLSLRGWLVVLALPFCVSAMAATVYKTVDEQGVVSFSDIPPVGDQSVQTMEINASTPAGSEDAQQRLEDMRETTDRMAADRREREKHRAELRKQQAESRAQAQAQYPQADYPYYGYTGSYRYNRYPRRRPGGGWHHPRPEHPIARPPLRPGHGYRPEVLPSRPVIDYPASLIRKSYSPPVRAAFER
jgi:TolA-binding protein